MYSTFKDNLMKKIFAISTIILIVFSCSHAPPESPSHPAFERHYKVCEMGCKHMETLIEEADDKKGCKQSREYNDVSCAEYCAKRLMEDETSLNPKCWTTLEACGDFEEKCNYGELYPMRQFKGF